MALATSSHPGEDGPRPSVALVAALADLRRWNRTMFRAGDVGRAAGLGGKALRLAIEQAQAEGSILVEDRDSGRWIGIDPTASSAWAPLRPKPQTRDLDPVRLGPSPRSPLVGELAREPSAIVRVEPFADRLGQDPADVWVALELASAEGLVDLWPDHPLGPSAGLSALAAGRLGLALTGDGSRWLWRDQDDPTDADFDRRSMRVADLDLADDLDLFDAMPDPEALEPIAGMIGAEDDHARALAELADVVADEEAIRARGNGKPPEVYSDTRDLDAWHARIFPQPRMILGLALQWPVPPSDGPCRGCLDRDLDRLAYCSICHRSGLDGILPPVPTPRAPRMLRDRTRSAARLQLDDGFKGGVG